MNEHLNLRLEVDGHAVAVSPDATVLDACNAAGANVPTLCHVLAKASRSEAAHENVHTTKGVGFKSGGHCRACMVEVDGRMVASCTTPARAGSRIATHGPALDAYRQDLFELMAVEARLAGHAAELAIAHDATRGRYGPSRALAAPAVVDRSHPYLRFDASLCIRCRVCERACDSQQGQFVWAFAGRGAATHAIFGKTGAPFAESACVSCGACASYCPTGAVSDRDRDRAHHVAAVRTVQTTCGYCGVGCQLAVTIGDDDRVLVVNGVRDAAANHGHLCVKGRYAHAFSRHPERLTTPLIRKDGVLVPASWDEALDTVVRGLEARRGAVAGLSSSRCTNEENYLLQKWIRAGFGSNHIDCCARVCHGPSAAGMRHVFGTGAATNQLADIEQSDCLLVSGSNATEAHPVTGARIRQQVLRERAKLVVIDPRKTELAAIADVHLQLRPGTNVPLLHAMAHAIVALDLVDHAFVAARTEGWASYVAFLRGWSPEGTEATTGVPAERVWAAARLYGSAKRPMQAHGLGMTEHYQGSEGVMLLCNLAMLVGAIGREGVGVNPLRGQNNVQGAADMGCQPDLLTGYQRPGDPAVRARFEAVWGRPVPTETGLTLPKMYDAARAGTLKALFILGEDVVQTDPSIHVDAALAALEFLVVQEIFLTETAKRADVVLPGASFLEKDGTFTNGERRIQRVRKALDPMPGARADWQVLCELMARSGLPQTFESPADIMDEVARVNPAFAGVSHARLGDDGLQWPVPSIDSPGTARLHLTAFPTSPTGRAHFAEVPWLESPGLAKAASYPIRLVTGRVLEHYNCGSMTRRSDNVVLAPDDALELHADDARAAGIRDGEDCVIESPWGEMTARAVISARVGPGTAFVSFHFPESGTAHVLSPVLDRLADCPEYKVTPIRIKARPEEKCTSG